MKLISILILPLFFLSACSHQDVWKTTVDENQVQNYDDIHQDLGVAYSESENSISVTSSFRKGAYGASLQLDGDAFVTLDSAPLEFIYNSAVGGGTTGSYYSATLYNPPSLTKDYWFSWKARYSRRFENRVQLPSKFSVVSSSYRISRGTSLVTLYCGGDSIAPNESVDFNIEGDFGYYIGVSALPPGQTFVTLDLSNYVDRSRLGPSTIVIHPFKRRQGLLLDAPNAGGNYTSSYELPPLRILVD